VAQVHDADRVDHIVLLKCWVNVRSYVSVRPTHKDLPVRNGRAGGGGSLRRLAWRTINPRSNEKRGGLFGMKLETTKGQISDGKVCETTVFLLIRFQELL
jgi:hypothetical protein